MIRLDIFRTLTVVEVEDGMVVEKRRALISEAIVGRQSTTSVDGR